MAYNTAYSRGIQIALQTMGLEKLARKSDEGVSPTQAAVIGGAAASPFLGLAGKPAEYAHDLEKLPGRKQFKTLKQLSRAAQPGDVILMTYNHRSLWKTPQVAMTGDNFHHVAAVVGRQKGHGTVASAGEYVYYDKKAPLRKLVRDADKIVDLPKEDYTDFILLRPKGITAAQRKAFVENAMERSRRQYSHATAAGAWLDNVFVPRRGALGEAGKRTTCHGNVCSTLPAQAYREAAGFDVLPNKASNRIMPSDYLRSDKFNVVGVRAKHKEMLKTPKNVKALLPRAGLGLALAGGAYGATEYPDVSVPAAGAFAGYHAPSLLSKEEIPSLLRFKKTFTEAPRFKPGVISQVRKDFSGKRLLPAALGGAAAYAGLQKIRELREAVESGK